MVEFGAEVEITYVMGGLAREFEDRAGLVMSLARALRRVGHAG